MQKRRLIVKNQTSFSMQNAVRPDRFNIPTEFYFHAYFPRTKLFIINRVRSRRRRFVMSRWYISRSLRLRVDMYLLCA